jgi:hypothetical protein
MQEKSIDFLKEATAEERAEALKADSKERAEALKAASAAVSIETVTKTTTTVSQQSTSSVVTVVTVATTPLMAGQIFRDFLISTRSNKLPIHDSITKKITSHIAHEYTMNFRVKDTISFAPFNGGKRQEWTRIIKTKGGVSPRSVQRYTQRASGFGDIFLGDAHLTVRDEVLKRVASNVGPSLVKYKHGRQLIVTSPEDQILLQQTRMVSGRQMIMFHHILVGLTGISIHSTSMTLTTLQDKQIPDYTITLVKFLVNKTMLPRRVF